MHAVPGAGPATLSAGGTTVGGPVSFGQVGSYAEVPGGSVDLTLAGADGKGLSKATEELAEDGRYTIVALQPNGGVSLRPYRDGRPRAGRARVRVIHAAPELGAVAASLDDRELGGPLQPGDASDYATVEPGTYDIKAMRTSGGGQPLASAPDTNLTAGSADTAFILGAGGERTRVTVASDGTAAPSEGPASGLGDQRGGTAWLLALCAALAAGALGGGLRHLVSRRHAS